MGGYTFADLGGFGAVSSDDMRHVPRRLKATLLHMFRRFRKARLADAALSLHVAATGLNGPETQSKTSPSNVADGSLA